MEIKEVASKTYKIAEKITIPLTLGVLIWALTTILSLSDRVTKIEVNARENEAQWSLLKQHNEAILEQRVQVELYKRLFEMLLDKNQIKIDRISLPALPLIEKRTLEEFRTEQVQKMRTMEKK
jgi:hypothetical protein